MLVTLAKELLNALNCTVIVLLYYNKEKLMRIVIENNEDYNKTKNVQPDCSNDVWEGLFLFGFRALTLLLSCDCERAVQSSPGSYALLSL